MIDDFRFGKVDRNSMRNLKSKIKKSKIET